MRKLLLPAIILAMVSCQTKSSETTTDSTGVIKTSVTPYGEVKTEVCTFKDYILGDCVRIDFSCGDFGPAQRGQLDEASMKLWSSLSVEDSTGNEVPNPLFVGKQFEIRFNKTKTSSCQDPSQEKKEIEVQNLLSFKLVNQ